jgi:type II secretory pathway pseudopilin PulG
MNLARAPDRPKLTPLPVIRERRGEGWRPVRAQDQTLTQPLPAYRERSRRNRAGFWLLELLFVIGLLAIVALIATKLFGATIRLGHDTAEAQNHAATLESLITAIRSDMWGAAKFETADEGRTVTLNLPGERTIAWSIADETITRTEKDGPPRRWAIAKGTIFAADGSLLVLRLPADGGEARFASERELIARLAP